MPSYLEREQPFERVQPALDNVQGLMNVYNTKLSLVGMGEGQLKSVYNSYSNLPLTREDNQNQLKGYLNQADQSLRSSVRTDLSVGDNAKSALGAFDPILQDSNVMGDYAYTKHIQGELQKAQSQRITNGGKDFNQASYDALQYQQQLFRMNPNKESWKMFYNSKDSYSQYYDKTAEMQKLEGMFKTDVIDKENDSESKGYIIGRKDSSWYKDRFQQFVEVNGSQQLKSQLNTEAKAEYRKSMVINADNPQRVYDVYKSAFDNMRSSKEIELNDRLNQSSLYLNTLNKSAVDYVEKKASYDKDIATVNDALKRLRDPNDPNNKLPLDIANPNNLPIGEAYASSLYQHNYFSQIGSAFAHRDIKTTIKSDAAYWANKGLEVKLAEMKQEGSQFGQTLEFKNRQLGQELTIAEMKDKTDLLIAGYKRDGTGAAVPLVGNVFKTNDAQNIGSTDPFTIGQQLVAGQEDLMKKGNTAVLDKIMGGHFGSEELIKALGDDGAKPFNQIITKGGVGADQRENIKKFIADAYWGNSIYKEMGITDTDPAKAKAKFAAVLDDQPAGKIKMLLNKAFSDDSVYSNVMNGLVDQPGGIKLKSTIEMAKQNMDNSIKGFNDRYGPKAAEYYKSIGYPNYVGVGTELYNKGVRGYEQGDGAKTGKYRVIPEDEMNTWSKASGRIVPARTVDLPDGGSYTIPEHTIEGGKNYMDGLYKVIGQEGQAGFNTLQSTTVVTDKNRQSASALISSAAARLTDDNTDDSKTIAALAQRNPTAISTYNIFSAGVVGKPKMSVIFDESKLGKDDKALLAGIKNYQDVRIGSDSDLIPTQFRTNDPGYISLMTQPKKFDLDYGDKSIAKGSISVENSGSGSGNSWNDPYFKMKVDFYIPSLGPKGEVQRDANGQLKLIHINDGNLAQYAPSWNMPNIQENLQTNPSAVYNFVANKANAYKELIGYINRKGVTSLSDPKYKGLLDEIKELNDGR